MFQTAVANLDAARSAQSIKTILFQETTLNGPVGATGIQFSSFNFGTFNEDLGIAMVDAPNKLYPSSATKSKVRNSGDGNGVPNPNELVYLLSSFVGASTVTIPTHTGVFILDLNGSVAPYTLTLNAVTTANIAASATSDAVEDAMIAAFGRGCASVLQEAVGVYRITLQGEYAISSALTVSGAAICVPFAPTAGSGIVRHAFDLDKIDITKIRSWRVYQGELDTPLAGKRYNAIRTSSFDIEVTEAAATCNASFFGMTTQTGQTILSSSVADVPQVNASVTGPGEGEEWNFYYGSAKNGAFGPMRLCDGFRMQSSWSDLLSPYNTVGCRNRSYRNATASAPQTSFEVSFAQNLEGDTLIEGMKNGDNRYAVAEWIGGEIAPGVPYRILVLTPHIILTYTQGTAGDNNNVATYDATGGITSTASLKPMIIIDCIVPAL